MKPKIAVLLLAVLLCLTTGCNNASHIAEMPDPISSSDSNIVPSEAETAQAEKKTEVDRPQSTESQTDSRAAEFPASVSESDTQTTEVPDQADHSTAVLPQPSEPEKKTDESERRPETAAPTEKEQPTPPATEESTTPEPPKEEPAEPVFDIDYWISFAKSYAESIGLVLNNGAVYCWDKTTFSVSLLDRLWKDHNIPFLVIEPAKNEYRALVQSIPELQVFTPGKNFISPFVFNPFVPPKNVKLETYKSTLKTAFAAGVSMSTPLDKIFEESINNCYSDFRWLDTYTVDDKGKIFNISDFIKCFQQTFDEIGYTGDAKNIGRAGVVRLNSLVNLFDNYFSIPIEDILQKPTIIELAAIENSDQKALIIALLLLSILAYVNANYIGEGGLKNVILLEEAHVLLDADTNAGQGDANPSAIAQGLVKRMLAEIRSYGVGLIIADQSPRKVSTDVVALTDMKMIFRLVESVDKQIIGDSTNMTDVQVQRMAKLKPGEAFLFFNKLEEPEEVITPDYRLENNISITLSDDGIRALSTYWNNKAEKLRPYPECQCVACCSKTCDYARRILAREVARRIFVKNFRSDTKDFEILKKVFRRISQMIQAELNDEEFTPELLSCVKVHLWRRIKYGTKIQIRDTQIENSLRK